MNENGCVVFKASKFKTAKCFLFCYFVLDPPNIICYINEGSLKFYVKMHTPV